MTSPQQAKGDTYERALVRWFNEHGFPGVERRYGSGRPDDTGDLLGLPGFTVEVKNHRRIDLAAFIDEAKVEALNDGRGTLPVVICKRPRKGDPGDHYVIMEVRAFAELVDR